MSYVPCPICNRVNFMNKKRSIFNKLFDVIFDKELRSIILLFFISLYFFVTAFYSYGKVDLSELEKVDGTVTDIEIDYVSKNHYVIFKIGAENFFVSIDKLKSINKEDFVNALENTFTANQKVTVLYTKRCILLPPTFYDILNYNRVVSIQTEEQTIMSIDDYNDSNQGALIGLVIFAIIFLF